MPVCRTWIQAALDKFIMEVIKFGGSSLVDAAAMSQVADVLWARREVPKFVVLSAMGGVTDSLL